MSRSWASSTTMCESSSARTCGGRDVTVSGCEMSCFCLRGARCHGFVAGVRGVTVLFEGCEMSRFRGARCHGLAVWDALVYVREAS
eukprot:3941720-Rhodomonas_salina.1